MVINITNYTDRCFSVDDGKEVYSIIKLLLDKGDKVELSFDGIDAVTSSFVNSALIQLLDIFPFEYIKNNLMFIHSNKGINKLIKSRFDFEVRERPTTFPRI